MIPFPFVTMTVVLWAPKSGYLCLWPASTYPYKFWPHMLDSVFQACQNCNPGQRYWSRTSSVPGQEGLPIEIDVSRRTGSRSG